MEASSENARKIHPRLKKHTDPFCSASSKQYIVMSLAVKGLRIALTRLFLSCLNVTSCFLCQQYLLVILTSFHLGQLNVRVFSAVRILSV